MQNTIRKTLEATRRCLLALLVVPLGACSLAPEYARPDSALPTEYNLAEGTGRAAAGPELTEFSPENREWWKNFNSSALPALQALALKNNHSFAAERWVLAQNFSQARASRSKLFPSLDVGASASRRGSEGSGGYNVSDAFSGTMQASYELDLWGKNADSADAKEFRALAGMYSWRGAGLSLESEVALTYFSWLAAKENLAVYESMLQNAREVLEYQEKRERLGAIAPYELARQRGSVQSMEAQRVSYLNKMSEARNNLCLLLGVTELPGELAALIERDKLMDILPPGVREGLPSELLTRRPDIAEAEARLMAANANIGVARAAFLPGISLTASAGWQSSSLDSLISPSSALYSLASSLMMPIFNNGELNAQLDEATAAKEELVERYRQSALSAFWEVSTALSASSLLSTQEEHRGQAAAEASEAYRIARIRYASGAEDFLSVLDAQDAVLSADSNLVQVRLERLNSVVSLFKALGGGWAEEGDMEEMRQEFESAPLLTF